MKVAYERHMIAIELVQDRTLIDGDASNSDDVSGQSPPGGASQTQQGVGGLRRRVEGNRKQRQNEACHDGKDDVTKKTTRKTNSSRNVERDVVIVTSTCKYFQL